MRYLRLVILVIALNVMSRAEAASALRDIPLQEVQAAFDRPVPPHPRLFITDTQLAEIQTRIESQTPLRVFYQAMLRKADGILSAKPVERVKTGRRLLSVSRRCLDRVIHLSAAHRFSGKRNYLERAEKEMLAAAGFSDWNPSHFLDVAEMTAALAIGYDWLYDGLSAESRSTIRQAILDKGIEPSLKYTHWVRGNNNWNQVCNAGISLGVLALMEDEPELAERLIHRAVNGVQVAMAEYEPDGAYPEGPGYWAYGTTFNVILLAALESVLGTDFGLSEAPGFSRCAAYFLHVTGPTGLYFNYPDSGARGSFQPAVFWFAKRFHQPSYLWHQQQLWQEAIAEETPSELVRSRIAPLVLAWSQGQAAAPVTRSWKGRGSNPLAMFRTSWLDPDAVFLAIKGGSPSVNHGHMDVGSFVVDAQGLRWAIDLGPESYHKIESLGMKLWGRDQDAERWNIFRYNNYSHNTLVVNGQHQRVEGHAPIIRYSAEPSFSHVVFDLSEIYDGQLAEAIRGAALLPNETVLIQDELKALAQPATIRWAMATPAQVEIEDAKTALLKQDGKTMRLTVITGAKTQLRTYSTEPKADYDAANPGTRMVGFEVTLAAGQRVRMAVLLGSASEKARPSVELKPLLQWSNAQ